MKKRIVTGLAAAIALGSALHVTAAGHAAFEQPLKARQGQFNMLALNLGVLGGMARDASKYDADAAAAAAKSLAGVAMIDQSNLWPEGSDAMSIEGTRAEPAIWENPDDFAAKWGALQEAIAGVETAVADGQAAIGPALGALGGACKSCHQSYRTPE